MHFKAKELRQLLIWSLLLLAGALMSCSLPLYEKPPKQKSIEFKAGGETQCLADALPILQKFYEGSASNPELTKVWNCTTTALTVFKTSTRGQQADSYSPREVANFFEEYFLNEVKVSDELLLELMRIKQVFIGGRVDSITRAELDFTIQVFQTFRDQTIRLRPYMSIFSFRWKASGYDNLEQDTKFFEEANEAIQAVARDLAGMIGKHNPTYELSNFVTLLDQIAALYGTSWDLSQKISYYMPVIYKLKKSLAGGEERLVAPSEWKSFLLLGARGYVQYLRYHYFIKDIDQSKGGFQLAWVAQTVDDFFAFMGDAVASKPTRVLTRAELLEMVQSFSMFWDGEEFSDELMVELMKVKQLFFGGSIDSWVPEDFANARGKVTRFRFIVERLLPRVSVYALSWQSGQIPLNEVENIVIDSRDNLKTIAEQFGTIIETSYDLNDIAKIIEHFQNMFPSLMREWTWVNSVKKSIPVLIEIKNVLMSTSGSSVRRTQWPRFLGTLSEGYGHFLYYYYLVKPYDVSTNVGLKTSGRLLSNIHDYLEPILANKPSRKVDLEDFSRLIYALEKAGFIKGSINAKTIVSVFPVLTDKILLSREAREKNEVRGGLTAANLNFILAEYQSWILSQEQYDNLFNGQANLTPEQMKAGFAAFTNSGDSRYELKLVYDTSVPLLLDAQKRLQIFPVKAPLYSRQNADLINIYRVLVRTILNAYAVESKRAVNYQGVNVEELNTAFTELRPFMIELGLLNPSNTTFAESRFREASLFTPRANGDKYLSFTEGVDYVAMIFSGLEVHELMKEKLFLKCPVTPGNTTWEDKVGFACFQSAYHEEMFNGFLNIQNGLNYVSKLSPANWYIYSLNVLKSAGHLPNEESILLVQDSKLAPHVLQYIEMVILKYDQNRDGFLNTAESLTAFPVFREILKDIGGISSEKDLRAVFTYMMKYGRPPNRKKVKEILRYLDWRGNEQRWDVWADRKTLSEILGYIADEIAKKKKKSFLQKSILATSPTGLVSGY